MQSLCLFLFLLPLMEMGCWTWLSASLMNSRKPLKSKEEQARGELLSSLPHSLLFTYPPYVFSTPLFKEVVATAEEKQRLLEDMKRLKSNFEKPMLMHLEVSARTVAQAMQQWPRHQIPPLPSDDCTQEEFVNAKCRIMKYYHEQTKHDTGRSSRYACHLTRELFPLAEHPQNIYITVI